MEPPSLIGVRAEKCRRRLSDFVRYGWQALEPGTPLDWNWHLDAICDHVQWTFEEWAIKRLSVDIAGLLDDGRAASLGEIHEHVQGINHYARMVRTESTVMAMASQGLLSKRPEGYRLESDAGYTMQVQNLLINIPPRSLKSRIVSVCAPAWAWLDWPEMTFIALSANPRVSADNARDSRDLIMSGWYQSWFSPRWVLKDDRDAVSDFGIERPDGHGGMEKLGYRKSRGWFSSITGEGASCLLPDDPHDAEEVNSTVQREAVIKRWKNAIWNRVQDLRSSIRIGIMQRVHELDWSGYVLKAAKEDPAQPRWCHLRVPLQYFPKKACNTNMPTGDDGRYDRAGKKTWRDPRTAEKEIMDATRWTPAVVASEQVRLGSYGFSGQYDQDPEPATGGMFQRPWWRFWTTSHGHPPERRPDGCNKEPAIALPPMEVIAISVDSSGKKTTSGSETSILVVGASKNKRFVLADRTGHHSFMDSCHIVVDLWRQYPTASKLIIEDKALGPAMIEVCQNAGITGIIPISPTVSKEARATLAQPQVEAGDVYLCEGAEWLEPFVSQFAMFPKGERNDRVDTLAQALIELRGDPSLQLFLQAYG